MSVRDRTLTRRAATAILTSAALLAQRPAASQPLRTLRLASPPDDNTSAALYGIHAGVFTKHGLDVQLQKLNNGAATAAAVAGGSVDLGKTSLIALLQAHERGLPFVMVAGSGLFDIDKPTAGFVVAADGPIRKIADLDQQTVSTPSIGDIDQVAMSAWIDRGGGDASTVHFIELPTAAALAAIEAGRTAGANVQNPVFAQARQNPKLRVLGYPFGAIAPRFLLSAWFGTASFATANAETLRTFVAALREATAYASAHSEATAPLLSAYSGIPTATIDAMQRQPLTADLDPKEIQPVLDICLKGKLLKKSFPVADLFANLR